jgi:hypothetical protein
MAGGFDGVPDLSADSDSDSDKERASPDMAARLKTHAEKEKKTEEGVQRQAAGTLQENLPPCSTVAQSGAAAEDAYRRTLEYTLTKLLCVL